VVKVKVVPVLFN